MSERIRRFATKAALPVMAGLAIAHFTYGDSEPSTKHAVCEGSQEYVIGSGEGTSHLLAQIEGGSANPNDARSAIDAMNPSIDAEQLESSLLPEGVSVRLPAECFAQHANRYSD